MDALIFQGLIPEIPLDGNDLIGKFHAGEHLAKSGIGAVQMGGIAGHDEELAAGGIGHHGTGHGKHAVGMLQGVIHAVLGKFALDGIAGAADADALGAAALNHEAGDDPVENEAVIEAAVGQGGKIAHGLGRKFGVEFAGHFAAVFQFDDKSRVQSLFTHGDNRPFLQE